MPEPPRYWLPRDRIVLLLAVRGSGVLFVSDRRWDDPVAAQARGAEGFFYAGDERVHPAQWAETLAAFPDAESFSEGEWMERRP